MQKTKKRFLSALLACAMIVSLFPFAAFAGDQMASAKIIYVDANASVGGNGEKGSPYNDLQTAVNNASDGDIVHIAQGTYNVSNGLKVNHAVSIEGEGANTVIVGPINYYCGAYNGTIKVSNLTVKSPENNTTAEQAIWWSYNASSPLNGASLEVENCTIKDFLFGIGVNSSTQNCTLSVSNLKLDNVWCGANVSAAAGNTIQDFTVTDDSTVEYQIQVFAYDQGHAGGYYLTYQDYQADKELSNPALGNNVKPSAGQWPAEAKIGNNYYGSLADAVSNANDGQTITLLKDVVLDGTNKVDTQGILEITGKSITLDGNGYTISAENVAVNGTKGPSMINIQSNANVTVKNLTIDGQTETGTNTKHGLNVYQAAVTVDNVTIKNGNGYAIVANGSTATVNGLTTENNGWGGINVDNTSATAGLIVNDATITELNSIKFEKSNTAGEALSATINGGQFKYLVIGKDSDDTKLTVTGGTFETETPSDEVIAALGGKVADILDCIPDGYTYNPYTGEVYEIPPYTGKYSYAINVADADNGSVSVDKYATEGEKVTLTVSPDKAYKLDELTVTAGGKDVDLTDNGDGTYTFTMPSGNVKVSVTFVEDEDYVEPDNSISISMTIGSNDFVINNNIVTVPDAAPYIANDRTYVPFRALGEALGATVEWDNDARTVTYTLGDTTIVMTIGDTTYTINGVEKSMDVAPEITGDRTYVPVRFVAEGLGFKVTPLYADNGTTASVIFEK